MASPVGALASFSIDCPDPDALAPFYCALLGLEEAFATSDRGVICLAGAGPMLTFEGDSDAHIVRGLIAA